VGTAVGEGDTGVVGGVTAGEVCGCAAGAGVAVRLSVTSDGENVVAGDESDWSGHGVSIASVSMANPYPVPTAATSRTMEIVAKRIY